MTNKKEYRRAWYLKNKERVKEYNKGYRQKNRNKVLSRMAERHFERTFGMTSEQRDAMRASQGDRCFICERKFVSSKGTHIDHCHETGHVRGMLCTYCNTALGWFERREELIQEYRKRRMPFICTRPPAPYSTSS